MDLIPPNVPKYTGWFHRASIDVRDALRFLTTGRKSPLPDHLAIVREDLAVRCILPVRSCLHRVQQSGKAHSISRLSTFECGVVSFSEANPLPCRRSYRETNTMKCLQQPRAQFVNITRSIARGGEPARLASGGSQAVCPVTRSDPTPDSSLH